MRFVSPLIELVLPVDCAGCGMPGTGWCQGCAASLETGRSRAVRHPLGQVSDGTGGLVGAEVLTAARYRGPLRSALVAYKDGGRWDLAPILAAALAPVLAEARSELDLIDPGDGHDHGRRPPLVVPIPSRRAATRRRGDRPVELLVRMAMAGSARGPVRALQVARRTRDQSGLGAAERRRNLSGAMRVTPRFRRAVFGARCVVVDDIVTTGSTLIEGTRALMDGGARQVIAVALAATPSGSARSVRTRVGTPGLAPDLYRGR